MDDGMASVGRETAQTVLCAPFVLGVVPGAIVGGFDVHRRQITFDALDTLTGEVWRGQLESTPAAVVEWVGRFPGRVVHVAVEACTGWLFVCRSLEMTGAVAHLAEPVETSALRGRKRRAKTDRTDARWLRQLLCEGRLPEAWCPPEHVRQWRSRARLRNTLLAERTSWIQRIRATLYHHGVPGAPDDLRTLAGREFLQGLQLPSDAAERIRVALEIIDMLEIHLSAIERDLRALARRQNGCQALMGKYGMGELSALVTLVELGDVGRMHASRQAVRMAGLDIGVHRSDRHAQLGKLTRQGSAPLRWALFEAAQSACRPASPDYADYHALKDRGLSHNRASMTIARKLVRRSYHLLRALGPAALAPPEEPGNKRSDQAHTSMMRTTGAASSSSDRGTHAKRGGPPKTQRPQSLHTGTTDQPSRHRQPAPAVAGPDKAGRPRSHNPPHATKQTPPTSPSGPIPPIIPDRRATPSDRNPHAQKQPLALDTRERAQISDRWRRGLRLLRGRRPSPGNGLPNPRHRVGVRKRAREAPPSSSPQSQQWPTSAFTRAARALRRSHRRHCDRPDPAVSAPQRTFGFAQEGSSLPSAAGACFARKAVVRGRPPTARQGTRAITEAGRCRADGRGPARRRATRGRTH